MKAAVKARAGDGAAKACHPCHHLRPQEVLQVYLAAALEKLHGALMVLGLFTRFERAEVALLTRLGIDLTRIQSILASAELADHGSTPFKKMESTISTCKFRAIKPRLAASKQ